MAGTGVPSAEGKLRRCVTYVDGSCPGASRRWVSARVAAGPRHLRPHGRLGPRLVRDADGRGVVQRGAEEVRLAAGEPGPHVVAGAGQVVVGEQAQHVLAPGPEAEHHPGGERVGPLQPVCRVLGTHLPPGGGVLVGAVGHGRRHQPELHRVVVGDHEQLAGAAVPAPVLGVVLDALAASSDRPGSAGDVVRVDRPGFGGGVALRPQHHEVAAAGQPGADLEALVGLLQHQHVVGDRGADPVPPHLERPVGRVVHGVEEPGGVGAPGAAVVGARHRLGEVLAGAQVAEAELEDLLPGEVHGVGEQVLVGTDLTQAEVEIVRTLREQVLVQHDLRDRTISVAIGCGGLRIGCRVGARLSDFS